MFKWTVDLYVDPKLVADGFEITPARARSMLESQLPFALGHEFDARVTSAPAHIAVLKVQGYSGDEFNEELARRRTKK